MADNEKLSYFIEAGAEAGKYYLNFCAGFNHALGDISPMQVQRCVGVADRAFLIFYENALNAAYDQYGIPCGNAPDASAEDDVSPCAVCWCNTCATLETCTHFPPSDGITAPPCAACSLTDPLAPITAAAPCEGCENGQRWMPLG